MIFLSVKIVPHSWLEVSVQVMKGPSKNPLTLGRWDPIGPFLTKIEKIQPGVLTYPISKFKNPPFWTPIQCSNFDFYDIYLYNMHLYCEISVTSY